MIVKERKDYKENSLDSLSYINVPRTHESRHGRGEASEDHNGFHAETLLANIVDGVDMYQACTERSIACFGCSMVKLSK